MEENRLPELGRASKSQGKKIKSGVPRGGVEEPEKGGENSQERGVRASLKPGR